MSDINGVMRTCDGCKHSEFHPWPSLVIEGWKYINNKDYCPLCVKKFNSYYIKENNEKY